MGDRSEMECEQRQWIEISEHLGGLAETGGFLWVI